MKSSMTIGNKSIRARGEAANALFKALSEPSIPMPTQILACELAIEALLNVPCVGDKYDQQHSDTHMRAVVELKGMLTQAQQKP